MKKIKDYLNRINYSDSLEEIIFLSVVPLTVIVGIVSIAVFMASLGESVEFVTVFSSTFCAIIPVIIFIIGYITKKFKFFYSVFCLFLTCIFLPFTYFLNGGLYSGMPYFLLAALILTTFCSSKRTRYILFSISLAVDIIIIVVSILYPQILVNLDDDYVVYDMLISFALVAIAVLVSNTIVLDSFRNFNETKAILNRHMDKNVSDKLLQRALEKKEEDEKITVAVMFLDINNFTTISESMTAEKTSQFLNLFFDYADEYIHKYNGIIDKFIGDCIMAFFIEQNKGEHDAVKRASMVCLELRSKLEEVREEIFTVYGCELVFSGGISYGEVIMGEIGSKNRKDFTIIGDCVNVASRLEDLSTRNTVLLCEDSANEINGLMRIEPLPEKAVIRGKTAVSQIYSLISSDNDGTEYKISKRGKTLGWTFDICGCRGSFSISDQRFSHYGGDTSCYVLKKDDYAIIIDCGTGLQKARNIIQNCTKIDVLFTHVHYDHIIGLLDWSVFPKDAELTFYGNFKMWFGDRTISQLFRHPYWPVDISSGKMVSIDLNKVYQLGLGVNVEFYESSHPDNGTLINLFNENRHICILADCEDSSVIPDEMLKDCNIMLFDGMYEDENYDAHKGFGHSTWQEGVRLANRVKPDRLIITHHNTHSSDDILSKLEQQAKKEYPATTFAKAGDRFVL